MSAEKTMRKRVVQALRPLHAVSVENGVGIGTPDVSFCGGWLELKSLEDWPARPDTKVKIEHFTAEQKIWITRRLNAGGYVGLLLKIADDWMLFDTLKAICLAGSGLLTKQEMLSNANRAWVDGLQDEELLECLKKI